MVYKETSNIISKEHSMKNWREGSEQEGCESKPKAHLQGKSCDFMLKTGTTDIKAKKNFFSRKTSLNSSLKVVKGFPFL